MIQNNAYLANSFATAGKTLVLGIGQKGLFLQITTFQIFSIVSCLSDLVFFLSYCYKKSTL